MGTLNKIIKQYGFNGLITYLKLKTGKTNHINLHWLNNAVTLRNTAADKTLFKQIFIQQEYNFNTQINPRFIIDAGANIGLSALYFSQKFPSALIVAIEAEKDNYKLLCGNTKNHKNIKPLHAGVWHTQAFLEINNTGSDATGFMVEETSLEKSNSFKAITINDVVKTFSMPYIDILKIDIEGAEKELLSENNDWISKCRIIILELHDRKKKGCSKAFFNAFSRYDFRCYPLGQNFLLINNNLCS